MLETRFGVEIEMTGISRSKAAQVVSSVINGSVIYAGGAYGAYHALEPTGGRVWKIVSDASIRTSDTSGEYAGSDNSVELVTPILTYARDMTTLQEVVRGLRRAGAVANSSCGIHVHLDGAGHTAQTITNWINLIASHNDLLYNALAIPSERQVYCKKLDSAMVASVKRNKPKTLAALADIWYNSSGDTRHSRVEHYHRSRYQFLNLHSYFNCTHTVELRGFNSTLHAGEVRSYVVLALALDHMARTAKSVRSTTVQAENEKFAMRTWLNRLGLIGDDFKSCREHLTKNLTGCAAWRFGARH